MPMTAGCRISIGRQAYICTWLVCGEKPNPSSSTESTPPAACASRPCRRNRAPPVAMLFIASIDSSTADGSVLNAIVAIQNPPINESKRTKRRSLSAAERARPDSPSATMGQTKQNAKSNAQTQMGVCASRSTAATQRKPVARPMARG